MHLQKLITFSNQTKTTAANSEESLANGILSFYLLFLQKKVWLQLVI